MDLQMFKLILIISTLFYGVLSENGTKTDGNVTEVNSTFIWNNFTTILDNSTSIPGNLSGSRKINEYQEYCEESCNDINQVCVNHICQCSPQYTWNNLTNSCVFFVCQKSEECQTYDRNRFCNNGECVCNDNTESNDIYSYKCTQKSCSGQTECLRSSQCVNGKCECRSGDRMNFDKGTCHPPQPINCTSSMQCQLNAFCDSEGICKCKETFDEDMGSCKPRLCIPPKWANGKPNGCLGQNQLCYGFHCICAQDFFLSNITGKCELNTCVNSTDCLSRDENSFCSRGLCKCKSNFKNNLITKCSAQSCANDNSCPDPHSLCVNGLCECEPNYRLSNETGKCEQFFCKQSDECQSYDSKRHCVDGTCRCDQMFVPNVKNGLQCEHKSCLSSVECGLNNTVCMDSVCKCSPNFWYNETTQRCDFYECQNSRQCIDSFDFYSDRRVCRNGSCICADGWKSDETNGGKCVKSSTTYGQYCNSDNGCEREDQSETCVDSQCKCSPNFKYNQILDKCIPFRCQYNSDCMEYDSNRVCDNGKCNCLYNFVENQQNGGLCIKKSATYEMGCSLNSHCYESGQRCVDMSCECDVSFAWNQNTQKCEYFDCRSSSIHSCSQSSDFHRMCNVFGGGGCICDPLYTPDISNGNKCTFTPITFTPITISYDTYDYTWAYVTVPIVFILAFIGSILRLHRAVKKPTPNRMNVATVQPKV